VVTATRQPNDDKKSQAQQANCRSRNVTLAGYSGQAKSLNGEISRQRVAER